MLTVKSHGGKFNLWVLFSNSCELWVWLVRFPYPLAALQLGEPDYGWQLFWCSRLRPDVLGGDQLNESESFIAANLCLVSMHCQCLIRRKYSQSKYESISWIDSDCSRETCSNSRHGEMHFSPKSIEHIFSYHFGKLKKTIWIWFDLIPMTTKLWDWSIFFVWSKLLSH